MYLSFYLNAAVGQPRQRQQHVQRTNANQRRLMAHKLRRTIEDSTYTHTAIQYIIRILPVTITCTNTPLHQAYNTSCACEASYMGEGMEVVEFRGD